MAGRWASVVCIADERIAIPRCMCSGATTASAPIHYTDTGRCPYPVALVYDGDLLLAQTCCGGTSATLCTFPDCDESTDLLLGFWGSNTARPLPLCKYHLQRTLLRGPGTCQSVPGPLL